MGVYKDSYLANDDYNPFFVVTPDMILSEEELLNIALKEFVKTTLTEKVIQEKSTCLNARYSVCNGRPYFSFFALYICFGKSCFHPCSYIWYGDTVLTNLVGRFCCFKGAHSCPIQFQGDESTCFSSLVPFPTLIIQGGIESISRFLWERSMYSFACSGLV